jgi:hypothetical protein
VSSDSANSNGFLYFAVRPDATALTTGISVKIKPDWSVWASGSLDVGGGIEASGTIRAAVLASSGNISATGTVTAGGGIFPTSTLYVGGLPTVAHLEVTPSTTVFEQSGLLALTASSASATITFPVAFPHALIAIHPTFTASHTYQLGATSTAAVGVIFNPAPTTGSEGLYWTAIGR